MKLKVVITHLKKDPRAAWYYIQGNLRYSFYRSDWYKQKKFGSSLLRQHIVEQFIYRRDECGKENHDSDQPFVANPCFMNGSCLCCGCDTPELFFADKGCSVDKFDHCGHLKKCYPHMMSKKEWENFKW